MKTIPTNYIIRIYRRDGKKPDKITGTVEEVGVDGSRWFHAAEELMALLIKGTGRKLKGKSAIERRTEKRLRLRLPVKIKGTDADGRAFTEESLIKDLSSGGASFNMKNRLNINTRIRMIIDPGKASLAIRASVLRISPGMTGAEVGVVFSGRGDLYGRH